MQENVEEQESTSVGPNSKINKPSSKKLLVSAAERMCWGRISSERRETERWQLEWLGWQEAPYRLASVGHPSTSCHNITSTTFSCMFAFGIISQFHGPCTSQGWSAQGSLKRFSFFNRYLKRARKVGVYTSQSVCLGCVRPWAPCPGHDLKKKKKKKDWHVSHTQCLTDERGSSSGKSEHILWAHYPENIDGIQYTLCCLSFYCSLLTAEKCAVEVKIGLINFLGL